MNLKIVKSISWFTGVSMFMVGVLKFVNPFKGWYSEQIAKSELPFPSYELGIIGEIAIGVVLIYTMINADRLNALYFRRTISFSGLVVIGMMLMAFYVHFHPNVPASVLPLKVKPPFIPGLFLMSSVLNIYLVNQKETLYEG